ncbi:MAG: hypothetical protein C5B43_02430 [Verrucomicrobia bacterium]|nr:MAG: hypothetical protein C5B43_02430 [Verrucomicrobiota bacterium]
MQNPIKKITALIFFIFLSSFPCLIQASSLNIPDNEDEAKEYIKSLVHSKIQNRINPKYFAYFQKFLDALHGNPLKEDDSPNYLPDLINSLLTHPRWEVQLYTLDALRGCIRKNSITSDLICELNFTESIKTLLVHEHPEIILKTLALLDILLHKKLIDTVWTKLNLEKSLNSTWDSLKNLEEKKLIQPIQIQQIKMEIIKMEILYLLVTIHLDQKINNDIWPLKWKSKNSDKKSDL